MTRLSFSSWFQRGRTPRRSKDRSPGHKDVVSISSPFNATMAIHNDQNAQVRGIAVFCGSASGSDPAFANAAKSLGKAIAEAKRPLVYGGGSAGIMGVVSGAALEAGGDVVGVTPYAMVAAGGEVDQTKTIHKPHIQLQEQGREKVEMVIVNSMHERKAEMAKRSAAFVGLPGGYGTFEEASRPIPPNLVLEVVCWSQIGIHSKPVILVNVRNFWEPLRALIRNGIREGFILEKNERLVCFVEGPADVAEHGAFDWGRATLDALEQWEGVAASHFYNWHLRKDGETEEDTLGAT
ncbi:hypothetical protein C8Q78DRAFT_979708 [Trametes maxima]|nr:hypothetical protein C8Q78DRAFT_979708 [Trametes maxima]